MSQNSVAANRQHAIRTQRRLVKRNRPTAPVSDDGNVPRLSMEPDMTVANLVSASSQSRRARLAAAANPVLPGPSTSAVAVGETSGGELACITLANAQLRLDVAPTLGGGITRFDWRNDGALTPIFRRCRHVGADTQPNQ